MSDKSYIYDAIFIDRDGTLNPDPGYISSLKDFRLYPFTLDALKKLSTLSAHLCIVTNQSGVSRGLIDESELDKIHSYLISKIEERNVNISGLYICTDLPGSGSQRRKPKPGMFHEAEKDLSLKLDQCLMIGDSISDLEGGSNLNMDTMLVLTGRGQETQANLPHEFVVSFTVKNLLEGAEMLLDINN
jgi:D,D-heptose 1,7-bisphosphate phosphatase